MDRPERDGDGELAFEAGTDPVMDDEASLSARAAWLYYAAGLTQGEIAKRLNVPSTKAHRLVARATKSGMVRVFVEADIAECVSLEDRLASGFGLQFCRVAPELDEDPLPLKALALAGATYLRHALEQRQHSVIGLGHGRTLAAVVEHLPRMRVEEVRFVSLLGGLTRRFAANPFDVIHRIAERTGAEAYMLPAPLFARTASDRAVLMKQMGVAEVFAMGQEASLRLVGIGEVTVTSHLVTTGMVKPEELAELHRLGAAGEMLGHYFDAEGERLTGPMDDRVMAPSLEELRGRFTVAIAGGVDKTRAIRALLKSGLLQGLITDEATARGLVKLLPGPPAQPVRDGRAQKREC